MFGFQFHTLTTAQEGRDHAAWVSKNGRHIRLVTDLPDTAELDQWVAAFDTAVPLLAGYWGRNPSELHGWRITAYLMADKAKFLAAGTLPQSLPDFRFGYQVGDRIWVHHQPEAYYNLHLLLHEGAHAVTARLLGGGGPPWFMEGTAEWMSTHAWIPQADERPTQRLAIGIVPDAPARSPGWGRIELIEMARRQNRILTIESVMKYGDTAHRDVEPYAWSWLAVTLLDMYPEYHQARLAMAAHVSDRSPQFNNTLYGKLKAQWPLLAARWRMLAEDIDYAWESARHRVDLPTATTPWKQPTTMTLKTDHGWQAVAYPVTAGQSIHIEASGRYKIRGFDNPSANDLDDLDAFVFGGQYPVNHDWYSEPEGITIHYYRGQPLGKLMARLLPIPKSAQTPQLPRLADFPIGRSATITATEDAWLLLKINEPPGDYGDNEGELEITMEPLN